MDNQSSVEWLFHKLWDEPKDKFTWYALLSKAKEIHENEIAKSAARGYNTMSERFNLEKAVDFGQQYYKNKFVSSK